MNNMTLDDKYQPMLAQQATPEKVYLQARNDGIDNREAMALIARLFKLSIIEAKEISITADGEFSDLEEYQETLVDALKNLLDEAE